MAAIHWHAGVQRKTEGGRSCAVLPCSGGKIKKSLPAPGKSVLFHEGPPAHRRNGRGEKTVAHTRSEENTRVGGGMKELRGKMARRPIG